MDKGENPKSWISKKTAQPVPNPDTSLIEEAFQEVHATLTRLGEDVRALRGPPQIAEQVGRAKSLHGQSRRLATGRAGGYGRGRGKATATGVGHMGAM